MNKTKPYKLIIKPSIESKAKFLRIFPMKRKTFVEGEKLEISFELENMSDKDFPGGMLYLCINWPSQQQVRESFSILPLKPKQRSRTQFWPTEKFETVALSKGFALVYINMPETYDEQGKPHPVEFYSGRRVENFIDTRASITTIKVKSWEEIYEFWALIISAFSLLIIALDKIYWFLISKGILSP